MNKLIVRLSDETEFFNRGRTLARLADQGFTLPVERVISFGDPADLLKLLTPTKLAVLRSLKGMPGTITAISERLNLDHHIVSDDIAELEKAGLVKVETRPASGHGQVSEVMVTAQHFKLEALI